MLQQVQLPVTSTSLHYNSDNYTTAGALEWVSARCLQPTRPSTDSYTDTSCSQDEWRLTRARADRWLNVETWTEEMRSMRQSISTRVSIEFCDTFTRISRHVVQLSLSTSSSSSSSSPSLTEVYEIFSDKWCNSDKLVDRQTERHVKSHYDLRGHKFSLRYIMTPGNIILLAGSSSFAIVYRILLFQQPQ